MFGSGKSGNTASRTCGICGGAKTMVIGRCGTCRTLHCIRCDTAVLVGTRVGPPLLIAMLAQRGADFGNEA